jgi:DGQHR domain-containing protein
MAKTIVFDAVRLVQPIGELYVGSIPSSELWRICEYDIREIQMGRDGIYVATGVQRKLNEKRVEEIAAYVTAADATFPTAVVLAISSDCIHFDDVDTDEEGETADSKRAALTATLTVETEEVAEADDLFSYQRVARVIDGQHRIKGLQRANKEDFDVNVAIFVDADIEDQARIFATVNLAQTKVNKSLVYDLFSFSTSKSPEKYAHDACVSLDKTEGSPFEKRIKRLGTATPGRWNEEPLSQATVVEGILSHIVKDSIQLIADRDTGRRGRKFAPVSPEVAQRLVLRKFFVEGSAADIADVLWNYFEAVSKRWPEAWKVSGKGKILPRTNGYRAFMRFFRHAYNDIAAPGEIPTAANFLQVLKRVKLADDDFTTDRYPPGTSGETRLFHDLMAALAQ